ncbi:MAG: CheB methylesterase domain-containing protein, partial [Verrucomicrobiota bacterium]
ADDYVTKPTQMANPMDGIDTLKQDLVPKVLELCKRAQAKDETSNDTTLSIEKTISVSKSKTPKTESGFKVLTIGTSTGGPNALADFFEMMPGKLDVPILIVQHMPPMFTKILAERLTKLGPTEFHEGEDHMKVQPGHAYIAPGGKHMVVEKNGSGVVIRTNEEPLENSCRPAVDPLFRSIARVYGNKVLAVVMTGMGQDGARGCEVIAEKGGYIVAQDEASSVVWGMPGYVVGSGLADEILSLRDLPVAVSDKF